MIFVKPIGINFFKYNFFEKINVFRVFTGIYSRKKRIKN